MTKPNYVSPKYLQDHVHTSDIVTPPHELLSKLRNHGIVQAYALHDHFELYKYHLGWVGYCGIN